MGISSIYDRSCSLCPLHGETYDARVCIEGVGNKSRPRVMLVGTAPSLDEAKYNKAYADPSHQLLRKTLIKCGFTVSGPETDVFATYVLKCFPSGGVKQKNAKVCAEAYLKKEILELRPDLVFLLGKTAQTIVSKNNSPLAKTHGKVLNCEIDDFEFPAIPIEHPYSVFSEPAKLGQWEADIRRGKQYLDGDSDPYFSDDKLERFDFQVIEDIPTLKRVMSELVRNYKGSYLAVDIEASGLDSDMHRDYYIYTIQFGVVDIENSENNDKLPVYILPVHSTHYPDLGMDSQWQKTIRSLFRKFCQKFRVVAHNAKYDAKGLRAAGFGFIFMDRDTMMLWANAHGEASMSLKSISYQVTDIGGYEDLMKEYFEETGSYDAPPEILVPYGGLDIVVTRHLMFEMYNTVLTQKEKVYV